MVEQNLQNSKLWKLELNILKGKNQKNYSQNIIILPPSPQFLLFYMGKHINIYQYGIIPRKNGLSHVSTIPKV